MLAATPNAFCYLLIAGAGIGWVLTMHFRRSFIAHIRDIITTTIHTMPAISFFFFAGT